MIPFIVITRGTWGEFFKKLHQHMSEKKADGNKMVYLLPCAVIVLTNLEAI